jgi:BlaI family penicillinase repressor
MSKLKNTLTTPEWIVMDALWDREPQVLGEIIESIGDRVDWSYTTYASYMRILIDKGYVAFTTRGRMKFYSPAVTREECIESEGDSILEKLGGNGTEKLLLCMMKKTNLSREGQERMRALIDELSEKEGEDL